MTKLHDLYSEQGQSPWIDNIRRDSLRDGGLGRLVAEGIRGVTSNPTIFAKAMESGTDYDGQFARLLQDHTVEDSYWELAVTDIEEALRILRPVHDESRGSDGFVSIEVAPGLAHETDATISAARSLHERIAKPNLFVKIPGTAQGVPAFEAMTAEGRSINVTLLFSVKRYDEVIEAYLSGLESLAASGAGDLSHVHSVASFFVSRVDTEVDRRLGRIAEERGGAAASEASSLRGKAAVAQARLAYELFESRFRGPRWEALSARGANLQRPLWASTSTKNPDYPDLAYVDTLIGPHTVNTMPDQTVAAFLDHGTVSRTVDSGTDEARATLALLADIGVDMDDVAEVLEEEGVSSFAKSFDEVIQVLSDKANSLGARQASGPR